MGEDVIIGGGNLVNNQTDDGVDVIGSIQVDDAALQGGGKLVVNMLQYTPWYNNSGIGHDLNKLLSMPAGIREVEPCGEHWGEDDVSFFRTFDVPAGQAPAAIVYWLGYTTSNANKYGTTLSRIIPEQHPRYPWAYASEVEFVLGSGAIIDDPNVFALNPDGSQLTDQAGNTVRIPCLTYFNNDAAQASLNNSYQDGFLRYRVTYRPRDYEVRTDNDPVFLAAAQNGIPPEMTRWLTRMNENSLERLPIGNVPNHWLYVNYRESGKEVTVPASAFAAQNLPLQELTYIHRELPDPPDDAILACDGHVNSKPFDMPVPIQAGGNTILIGGYSWVDVHGQQQNGYPPGTILCKSPKRRRYRSRSGRVVWEMVYTFLFRQMDPLTTEDSSIGGWNYFPIPGGGGFDLVTFDGSKDGPTVYPEADLNDLFYPAFPGLYQGQFG